MRKLFVVFIFCFFSCEDCRLDEELRVDFKYNLKIVNDWVYNNKIVYEKDFLKALGYLSKTTGHQARVSLGYLGADYLSTEIYHEDVGIWKRWYEDNKCISSER